MRKLSVLIIHNQYQHSSGEDAVVLAEMEMLRRAGHRVIPYIRHNSEIAEFTGLRKARLLLSTTWDRKTYGEVRELTQRLRPDIAHCHNSLPLVSPAVYEACKRSGVPVVQTLHNYRLLCPAGTLYHNGKTCEDDACGLLHEVVRGCYRGSRLQTAAVAMMLAAHRFRHTWSEAVDAYIALSQFSRERFVRGGLPAGKLHVKPNFLAGDPGARTNAGEYAYFAGRLSAEKGVLEMVKAWRKLPHIPLMIAGDGPLRDEVSAFVRDSGSGHVKLLGQVPSDESRAHMKSARFLVFPSRWHEPFGLVLLEAAACGVPAIASRIGGVPEIVSDGSSGLLFDADNTDDLADKANWAWDHAGEMQSMGRAARKLYEQQYTVQANYELLTGIYKSVLSN